MTVIYFGIQIWAPYATLDQLKLHILSWGNPCKISVDLFNQSRHPELPCLTLEFTEFINNANWVMKYLTDRVWTKRRNLIYWCASVYVTDVPEVHRGCSCIKDELYRIWTWTDKHQQILRPLQLNYYPPDKQTQLLYRSLFWCSLYSQSIISHKCYNLLITLTTRPYLTWNDVKNDSQWELYSKLAIYQYNQYQMQG